MCSGVCPYTGLRGRPFRTRMWNWVMNSRNIVVLLFHWYLRWLPLQTSTCDAHTNRPVPRSRKKLHHIHHRSWSWYLSSLLLFVWIYLRSRQWMFQLFWDAAATVLCAWARVSAFCAQLWQPTLQVWQCRAALDTDIPWPAASFICGGQQCPYRSRWEVTKDPLHSHVNAQSQHCHHALVYEILQVQIKIKITVYFSSKWLHCSFVSTVHNLLHSFHYTVTIAFHQLSPCMHHSPSCQCHHM